MNLVAFAFKGIVDMLAFGKVLGIENDDEVEFSGGVVTPGVHYEDDFPADNNEGFWDGQG
jgi:hypothetical protein